MAQLTLDSKDIMRSLTSLAKRLADAIEWVSLHPRGIKIEMPDDLGQHYGGKFIRDENCDVPQLIEPKCLVFGVPEERAEVEILLGVLTKKGTRGTRRPKTRRRK
jgi:hypothetical protein